MKGPVKNQSEYQHLLRESLKLECSPRLGSELCVQEGEENIHALACNDSTGRQVGG